MSTINYKRFVTFVHKEFSDFITHDQADEWLRLDDDYNKDSPASLGKSLVITRLKFSGEKNNGEEINYDQPFSTGLTVWIAQNGRGKSSIYRIIKYCLTGHNTLKPDVRKWLSEIKLEFRISSELYTVLVDKQSRVSEGGLFRMSIEEFE